VLVRLTAVVGAVVVLAACNSDVSCPSGAIENDAGICVDIPKDSSSNAAAAGDAGLRHDGATSNPGGEPDGSARSREDASVIAPEQRDGGDDADAEAGQGAVTTLDSGSGDSSTSTFDATPGCLPTAESCNGLDDDCDGKVDEQEDLKDETLGQGCSNGGQGACAATGVVICSNGSIVCGAPPSMPEPEKCDGIDNDCNDKVDDGPSFAKKGSACTAGQGDCQGTGIWDCDPMDATKLRCTAMEKAKTCGSSCTPLATGKCYAGQGDCQGEGVWVCDSTTSAARCTAVEKPKTCPATGSCAALPAEVCGDGVDNDCDTVVDEGCVNKCGGTNMLPHDVGASCTFYQIGGCMYDTSYVCHSTNKNLTVCAGAKPIEVCNGKDDDCDGYVDNSCVSPCEAGQAAMPEMCNGADDDCDGDIDEAVAPAAQKFYVTGDDGTPFPVSPIVWLPGTGGVCP
jgi:hypothetical protein